MISPPPGLMMPDGARSARARVYAAVLSAIRRHASMFAVPPQMHAATESVIAELQRPDVARDLQTVLRESQEQRP